ncbi:MAG TPA: dihydroneopterin aldolase [Candidatus Dormibacteraeota bacterium]|jgi:dihydroneopterin aldolase|nr:dihydroneopterin aldolase [Candidatus Dormibacteraeota bacterium]
MDRILLEGMAFFGRHGVFPAERELGARFVVDVEIDTDLTTAAQTDQLGDTVDYAHVHALVKQILEGPPCNLLEAVAERIAIQVLSLSGVDQVKVRIQKRPPLDGEFRAFGIEITRGRKR